MRRMELSSNPLWWLRRATHSYLEGHLDLARTQAELSTERFDKKGLDQHFPMTQAALIEGKVARLMADFEPAEEALRRAQRLSWRGIDAVDRVHPEIRLELLQLDEARGNLTETGRDYEALIASFRHWGDLQLVAAARALACAIKVFDYDLAEKANAVLDELLPGAKIVEASGGRRWQAIYAIHRGAFEVAEERLADAGRIVGDSDLGAPLEVPLNGLAVAHLYLERGEPGDYELGCEQFLIAMNGARNCCLWGAMTTAANAMRDLLD